MSRVIHVLTERLTEPSGLGEIARNALRVGRPLELDECAQMRDATIVNVDYPRPLPEANRNYAWTVFESDRIPGSWVEAINACYRAVFVPHRSVQRAFLDSGVHKPVHVVPQGFKRLERTRPIPQFEGPLRVGILGVLVPRKNVTRLIQAVRELNEEGYDIRLRVQFTCWLIPEMEQVIESTRTDPRIDADFHPALSEQELAEWYSSLHAYVLPSSGEGWSMTPRESLHMGIPTVVSDIPAHRDVIASGGCTRIATAGTEPAYYPFLQDTCGQWSRVTVEAIKTALIDVHDDYEAKRAAAADASRWIASRWTWDAMVERVKHLVEADGAHAAGGPESPGIASP